MSLWSDYSQADENRDAVIRERWKGDLLVTSLVLGWHLARDVTILHHVLNGR